eukprot:403365504
MVNKSLVSTGRTFGIGFPHNQYQMDLTSRQGFSVGTPSLLMNNFNNELSNLTPQIKNLKSPTATTSMFNRHEKRARSINLNALETSQNYYKSKGGSPGGVFMYDTSRRSQNDDENQTNIVDFIKRNLNIGKVQKNMDFERQKDLIGKVYTKIKKRKDYGLDVKNLFNIQSCLNPKLKQQYLGNQGFFQIFTETNILNQTFMQIIDQVCCYRLELGMLLQKLVECYNSIILQQFEEFYRSENLKEKELTSKLDAQQQATDELFQKRLEFERRLDSVQAIISGKDAQIQSLEAELETMQQELKYLRELVDLDSGNVSMKKKLLGNDNKVEPNALNTRDDKVKALNRRESLKFGRSKQQQQERITAKEDFVDNIEDLNDVLKNLENEQTEKKNILNGMDRLLKTMLKTTKTSVGTQVEDGELFWKPQNYIGDTLSQGSNVKSGQALSKIQRSSRQLLASQDPKNQGVQQQSKGQIIQQSVHELEVINEVSRLAPNLTYTSPMEDYGNTSKMLQMKEEDRVAELEAKLNQMVNQVKNLADNQQDKGVGENGSLWNIPSHLLVFIANSIEDNQSGRVLPWPEFKQIIFEIYDHRLANASEVNGVINTSYLSFEEYILIFFLDKYKLRRLSELKLIETLTSLKYYLDIWPRAKCFAQLLNIVRPAKVQTQASQKKSQQQNLILQELSMPNIDIYYQEFFLYAYSVMQQDKEHFLESKDGVTYMKTSHEEHASQVLLSWFNEQETRKWFHKVRRNVKKIKTSQLDDFETDYIDIDVLLNMYCEEYKSKRKANQKNLSKEFMRKYQEQEGLFNTEEIDKIVQMCMPSISPSAFIKFPGVISIRRAFLYSLVCGENSFDVNTQEFIAGCNRFGIDNPCPIVTKRIALYGNDEDFEETIKKELIKSNIQQQSKIHTTKPNKSGIKIETARVSTNSFQKNDSSLMQQNSNQKSIVTGITNLKLVGRMHSQALDTGGSESILTGGVKLNIAQLSKDFTGDHSQSQQKKGNLTNEELSIGNKKIIIPSFSTTSALFSQHFSILRDLKKRIEGLKQAYYNQREEDRSWEQVEKILHVLEAACKFLDFPIQQ